jgi:hypothetical protein
MRVTKGTGELIGRTRALFADASGCKYFFGDVVVGDMFLRALDYKASDALQQAQPAMLSPVASCRAPTGRF